ncbi:unnamed protein product [Cladocopium goreaui]|uniref:Plastid lipid-associated protein/fibrillin conserved domain-containing protein n=1 Tax=Cladocopium goreaui TaxID=2562237 RepID=A0A9P1M5P8_9DINO|nr:unnamed protein product [Cladocopium goreaui]
MAASPCAALPPGATRIATSKTPLVAVTRVTVPSVTTWQNAVFKHWVWLAPALAVPGLRVHRHRGRRGRLLRRTRRRGSQWTEVAGCPVYFPEAEPPCCLVHFVGGAISGSLPRTSYSRFLEAIAEETGAVVVATPLNSSFDHDLAAKEAAEHMDNVLLSLQRQGLRRLATAPIWSCGHGTGAVVQLLVATRHRRAGLVLLGLTPARSLPLPNLPKPLARLLSGGLKRISKKQLKQGGRFAEALLRGVAELNSSAAEMETTSPTWPKLLKALESSPRGEVSNFPAQVFPGILSLAENVRNFTPSREELAEQIRAAAALPKRLLLVEFSNDPQDDSAWLLSVLGCQQKEPPQDAWDPLDAIEAELEKELAKSLEEAWEESDEEQEEDEEDEEDEEISEARKQLEAEWEADDGIQEWEEDQEQPRTVELIRLKGDSWIPLDFQDDLDQIPGAVARFLRREAPPQSGGAALRVAGAFALKAHLLRLTAGTNRGFGPLSFKLRGDILASIAELEKMSDGSLPVDGTVSEKLFGRWRLMWCTAPAVLLLGAMPFVDCGEIEQKFTKSGDSQQELELITCARLAPVGSALVPWLVPETQVRLRAKVEVISSRRFLLHFRSLDQLLLPTRNENLNITFLDDEIMIARSGDGAVFLWLRA